MTCCWSHLRAVIYVECCARYLASPLYIISSLLTPRYFPDTGIPRISTVSLLSSYERRDPAVVQCQVRHVVKAIAFTHRNVYVSTPTNDSNRCNNGTIVNECNNYVRLSARHRNIQTEMFSWAASRAALWWVTLSMRRAPE